MSFELTPVTYVFLTLSVVAVAATFVVVASRVGDMPERIPVHFGFRGEADAWGERRKIWLGPWISLGMFVLILVAAWTTIRDRHGDPALAPKLLEGMTAMGLVVTLTMLLAAWRWTAIALGNGKRLGWFVLVITVLFPLAVIFAYRTAFGF